MSKLVGNSACILAHVFNSASRQHCEVWASQFPFLHTLKDMALPGMACLYGHINGSLAQGQQQSSMGLSQFFFLCEVAKPDPGLGSISESSGASPAKRPHWEGRIVAHPGVRKSVGCSVSDSSADARKKGNCRGWYSWCVVVHRLLITVICCFAGWYAFTVLEKHYFQQVCA